MTRTTHHNPEIPRITPAQLALFRRIQHAFPGKADLPLEDAWRNASNDDIWIRVVSQVVVVGRADPADRLREKLIHERIAWKRLSQMSDSAAANDIWQVLRDIGARYSGRTVQSCRKTAALMRNLDYLKRYPNGPKGFLRDVATLPGSSRDKVAFVSKPLSYIKNKGARDFLTTGFGLVKDHIALDSRILNVLHLVGVKIPARGKLNSTVYDALERMLLEQVCRPLGVSGAELDQLLFNNYRDIKSMLGSCP